MVAAGDSFVITGIGMASSLGLDAVTACAAARAGLTRPEALAFEVEDEEAFEMVPVIGHPVGWFTEGFADLGRLVRLATLALKDLMRRTGFDAHEMAQSALLLNLASGYYVEQAERLRAEEQVAESHTVPEPAPPYTDIMAWYEQRLVPRLLDVLGLAAQPVHTRLLYDDQAGVASTLAIARELLTAGHVPQCIVGGVDSLLDVRWMQACDELGLLKTEGHPNGFMPGEGAAFLRLETYEHARQRQAPVLAYVGTPVVRRDALHRFADRPPDGILLSEVILDAVNQKQAVCRACIGSINGDPVRSSEWGNAWVRLQPQLPLEAAIYPAASFGETGAACGFIGACMGVRAFARGYAPAETMVVWASSDAGLKAGFTLTQGNYTEQR